MLLPFPTEFPREALTVVFDLWQGKKVEMRYAAQCAGTTAMWGLGFMFPERIQSEPWPTEFPSEEEAFKQLLAEPAEGEPKQCLFALAATIVVTVFAVKALDKISKREE